MNHERVHASRKEVSKPAAADKRAPEAKPASRALGVFPTHTLGTSSPDDLHLTRDRVMFLQRAIGNRAVGRVLQRRMRVSEPEDEEEREAERVMREPEPAGEIQRQAAGQEPRALPEEEEEEVVRTARAAPPVPLQRRAGPLEERDKPLEEEEQPLQAARDGEAAPHVSDDVESHLKSLRGGGEPLADSTREFFESRMGQDFSGVRVHTDAAAADTARALNARAFTTGQDIVFAPGQFSPQTGEGKSLLAHELTHVVQQAAGPVAGTPAGGGVSLSDPTDPFEQAASRAAEQVMRQAPEEDEEEAPPVQLKPAAPVQAATFVRRQDAASLRSEAAGELISKHTSFLGDLDEEGLGQELAGMLPANTIIVHQVFNMLSDSDTDDVAQEIVIALGGRLPTVDSWLRLRFIREMVTGTVTDYEEGVIADIWASFGEQMKDLAAEHLWLWRESIDESDQLNELPQVADIRNQFEHDVIRLASTYLGENRLEVLRESERLGIRPLFRGEEMVVEPGYLQSLQVIAGKVASLQNFLKELRRIQVGYFRARDPEARITEEYPSYFNPDRPPSIGPKGNEVPPLPAWSVVKEQHDRASAVISGFANTYPTIYALLRDDRLEELAEAEDTTKAMVLIADSLWKVIEKIDESQQKLDTDDIEFSDLVPVYTQLFSGSVPVPFTPRYEWSNPFYQEVAKDVLEDKEARDFWTSLGLSLVAAAAIIAAPFTGGASLLLLGVGLGIGAYQAAVAWEKYDDLKTMSGAHVRDELALISEGQVTAALIDAVLATASLFLDAFGARAATTGARTAARTAEAARAAKAFELEEQALKQQMAREARRRATREAAIDATMEAAGAGLAVAQHELFGEEEPEFEGEVRGAEIDLAGGVGEASPAPVSRMVIQRQAGGGGGVPTMPAVSGTTPPTLSWSEFEDYVARAFKRGEFGAALRMDHMIPGQYTGSGHGIDLFGIRIDDAGRISVIQVEVKYVQPGSPHEPHLGRRSTGTQTGANWTENAIEKFLTQDHPVADRHRERLRRALQRTYGKSYVTNDEIRKFLRQRLPNARVFVVTPDYAVLKKLHKQVAGLVRHGRRIAVKTIRIR